MYVLVVGGLTRRAECDAFVGRLKQEPHQTLFGLFARAEEFQTGVLGGSDQSGEVERLVMERMQHYGLQVQIAVPDSEWLQGM